MKLAFIGIGNVGFALANNLQKSGHEIIIAHADVKSKSVVQAQERNPSFTAMGVQEAVHTADIIFLATPFKVNANVLHGIDLKGKILIDCTNPVGLGMSHGLESKLSGAEKVQEWATHSRVVKSYTIYGFENLENSAFPDYVVKPVMMIAGNDTQAKQQVATLNTHLGFETLDVGDLSQSLHLEHMTLLWVKMVRMNGHDPNFTWAKLKR